MFSVPKSSRIIVLLLLVLAVAVCPAVAQEGRTILGQPGYVIIEGVRDSTTEFTWQDGPAPGRHSLVWAEGTLSLPESLELDAFGEQDAGVACLAGLSGVGGSGRLVFVDGIYKISEPVLLADGNLELHISAGELEVRGDQIRYRRPESKNQGQDNSQANYIFLAGLVVLIIVLMRRARRRVGKS
ncbi:MAG: hypothetical protein QNL91_17700 [Candidatus Krumholzibacteria bacterium]|nr:hypothetical protein [Candidatus Krumholzibacteria bacterium]